MTESYKHNIILDDFTYDQVEEINQGLNDGLDVSFYARKELFAIQMRQIRQGLMEGVDVNEYASPEYDWFQMEEIRKGLLSGVDVSLYKSPSVTYDRMRQIRKGLEQGVDLSRYIKLSAGILRQLREASLAKVNIIDYIKEGYEPEQLEEIRRALEQGVDIKPYISMEYRGMAIRQICQGLEAGLDVTIYAKIHFDWRQMQEIRMGLENRVDVTRYSNPLYSWQQMRELRLGLEDGLDIDSYKSFMYTAVEMRKKRLKLEEQTEYIPDESDELEDILGGRHAKVAFPEFSVKISDDEMTAFIVLNVRNTPLRKNDIELALRQEGIKKGVDSKVIRLLEQGSYTDSIVKVAEGKKPQDGDDGWYEFFFRTSVAKTPKQLMNGSVDYQNIEWYEIVRKGQKLAVYHEAAEGTEGYTVLGKTILAKKGREKKILTGKGFSVSADGKTYVADIDGKIEFKEDRIEISRLLIVDEVSIAGGNINFDGSVYVKGDVGTGARIEASEDVVVDGFVEDAIIECGGNVVIRKGMNGGGTGYIRSLGYVIGKFFEAARIRVSGDIRADYCMNCDLYSEGQIIVTGGKGSIIGGLCCALEGIKADNLGNNSGIATFVKLGVNDTIISQINNIDSNIVGVDHELKILRNAYADFLTKYPSEVRNTMDMFLKIESAIFTKEKELENLQASRRQMEEHMRSIQDAKVVVQNTLYDGVLFEINGIKWSSKKIRAVTIKCVERRIAVYAN